MFYFGLLVSFETLLCVNLCNCINALKIEQKGSYFLKLPRRILHIKTIYAFPQLATRWHHRITLLFWDCLIFDLFEKAWRGGLCKKIKMRERNWWVTTEMQLFSVLLCCHSAEQECSSGICWTKQTKHNHYLSPDCFKRQWKGNTELRHHKYNRLPYVQKLQNLNER